MELWPTIHGNMQAAFQTTRWTMILQAGNRSNKVEQQAALEELISRNWFPLYTYLRRGNMPADEAEDLIQGFFARLIEKNMLENIEGAHRGRFRNFLLVCLKRYVIGEWQKSQAQRRGGGQRKLSLDFQDADRRYQVEPFHELTPENAFNRSWALDVIDQALETVRQAWAEAGKSDRFEALKVHLTGSDRAPSYHELSEKLSVSESSLRVTVHRLRAEFRTAICDIVADTLESGDLLEDEINFLFSALNS